jgi:small GTP-binding protein
MKNIDDASPKRRSGKWPLGFRLRFTLRDHISWISTVAWAPTETYLASASDDNTIRIWDVATGQLVRILSGHDDTVFSVAWSPSGQILASSSDDETIICWDTETGQQLSRLTGHRSGVVTVAWLPDGQTLVSGSGDRTLRFWNALQGDLQEEVPAHEAWVRQIAVSPDNSLLASASYDRTIKLWDLRTRKCVKILEGHRDYVHSIAWAPDGSTLASASKDLTVRIWEPKAGRVVQVLEGHTAAVYSVSFSRDSQLLATKALDSTVRIWQCGSWQTLAILPEESIMTAFGSLAFAAGDENLLATLGEMDTVIRVWAIDSAALLQERSTQKAVHYTSAKIVLVGESNVGKSCLALRLAEDRYEEQGTTHGMRFWELDPAQLQPDAIAPSSEAREVVLWDLGGQEEYRLIHQIFLHDTTLALILLDPTRGRSAFDDVEAWNRRLEKQLHGRKAVKLLVGTKLDSEDAVLDLAAIERLKSNCGFLAFLPTSSRTGRGLQELRSAIANAIDWEFLARTSRPEVFQHIRDAIEKARLRGEVVLLVSDLERGLPALGEGADEGAVGAVIEQLALQGLVADTQLATGEQALVLQIAEVERYGGSLILAAKLNPRGVPALEERLVGSKKMTFPRIDSSERLPWLQERVVLECVIELLLRHGIALRHEGLLIFPALFRTTEKTDSSLTGLSISLYYDFTGAIDNIYSALVARLAISETFGRYRLWESRAEFEAVGQGTCGLRTVAHPSGVAHLDVYFSDEVKRAQRHLFLVFIEDHLRTQGVSITENIEMTCSCGSKLSEQAIRLRLAGGYRDILCSACERRSSISAGAKHAIATDPGLETSLIALKTVIAANTQSQAKLVPGIVFYDRPSTDTIRILHLSDLHMKPDSEPRSMLQQLEADLKDKDGGLGFDRLDYMLVSGDLSSRALPAEFELAYEFVSGVIKRFDLTAQQCIIVPGNHDLNWDELVYDWKPLRQVELDRLDPRTYVKQGEGVLVRNEAKYPLRLRNFTDRFYKFLTQEEYPLDSKQQCIPFLFTEGRLQILAVNSCWEIDEFNRERASIYAAALARGLDEAEDQIRVAREARLLSDDASVLRIAVWHHPVSGNDKIQDDAFLDRLRKAGFKLCVHGHVHELRADVIGYSHPRRKIYVAGAGAFGADARDRPEATPRLYNVLEIKRDHSEVKVHTRCMMKPDGAWEGWAVWDGGRSGRRLTYYRIRLR